MFGLGPATKIYLSLEGVDMRKGFDGLYGLVRDHANRSRASRRESVSRTPAGKGCPRACRVWKK